MEQTLPVHNPAPAGIPTLTEKEHQPHPARSSWAIS